MTKSRRKAVFDIRNANGGWLRPCTLGDSLLLVQEKVTKEKDTRPLRRPNNGRHPVLRADQALA